MMQVEDDQIEGGVNTKKATIIDMSDMQKKLLRKGVLPSLSLAYKKPNASLLIGSHKLRTVRRDDKKKNN